MKATWLFDEHPLVIDVKLAQAIGLNQAIVLQQLNYWLHSRSAKKIDGKLWVYNRIKDWNEQFPFWSKNTVQRTLESLEKAGLVVTGNFNRYKFDRTKWYSINQAELVNRMTQFGVKGEPNLGSSQLPNLGNTIPDTNTETNSDTNSNGQARPDDTASLRKEVIDYLNSKLDAHYKPNASKNKQVINARLKEGYTLDDFKKVIDNKIIEWANDEKMSKYLRPETLFGTKMEGYVNEKVKVGRKPAFNEDQFFNDNSDPLEGVNIDDLPFK